MWYILQAMGKVNILLRVGKKAAKKALRGDFQYRGRSLSELTLSAARYAVKHGPKKFVRRLKQGIVNADRRVGSNLAFPNGMVTGADMPAILGWYKEHARPITVVIPSYNDAEVLGPCVASIK